MADNTANEGLWLPVEAWATIASFLDHHDLAQFKLLCHATQLVGSDVFVLQPFYNRLYALNNTLDPVLSQQGALTAFKQAFKKIQAQQQSEIDYLKKYHPERMKLSEHVFQANTAISLQSLEAIHTELDNINSDIIREKIDLNSTSLNLFYARITRLPVTLFQESAYISFWRHLINLDCRNNQLTTLNVQELTTLKDLECGNNYLTSLNTQGLAALISLRCYNNQLTSLNVQELVALQDLYCNDNQLTVLNLQKLIELEDLDCNSNQLSSLNVQRLTALEYLNCDDNPLETLILTGVHTSTKNKYAELERTLLFNKLSQIESPEARQDIIHQLGDDYTEVNCLKYCPDYAASLFKIDSATANNPLSQAPVLLSFFETVNTGLKRKRDENEVDAEELSQEENLEPALKKRKK